MLLYVLWIIVNIIPGSIWVATVIDDDVIFNRYRSRFGLTILMLLIVGTILFCNWRYSCIHACFYGAVPFSIFVVHAILHVLRVRRYNEIDEG